MGSPPSLDSQARAVHEAARSHPTLMQRGLVGGRALLAAQRPQADAYADRCAEFTVGVPAGQGEIGMTVYRPSALPRPAPVLLFIHGGGWVFDSPATPSTARRLAVEGGLAVAAVDYRLAPEHPFPVPLDDCLAALRWIADRGSGQGLDPARITVCGESSGANLAAALAIRVRDQGGPAITEQVLVCPVLDPAMDSASWTELGAEFVPDRAQMEWMWRLYVPSRELERHPYVSPARADNLHGLAPATVLTAEFDPLRDEGELYARQLRAAGVPVEARRCAGQLHAIFGMARAVDACAETLATVAAAVGTRLRAVSPPLATHR
jgi:acetyl esterase